MKKIILTLLPGFYLATAFAQQGWQHKDLAADSIFGVSTQQAYELLKGKKGKTVLVAVIDSGIDSVHADLRPVLWQNPRERKNGKDDDRNGYADDTFGWSFLGSARGSILHENAELTRFVRDGQRRFPDLANLPADTSGLALYKTRRKLWQSELAKARLQLNGVTRMKVMTDSLLLAIGKPDPTRADVLAFQPNTVQQASLRSMLLRGSKDYPSILAWKAKEIDGAYDHFKTEVDHKWNLDHNPRATLVGDNLADLHESRYGTADAMGPDASHGTHVAGIIGALRGNALGLDGVADNVRIMSVRAVPDGDERDKDIANAIRYAVDNGAKVINMSFGKAISPNKPLVDEAVKYAMQKDVLLVHAAGNDTKDLDVMENYPNRRYADGSGEAVAWLEVGASGPKLGDHLPAGFSNYGKHTVDLFAPGVAIWSAMPHNNYANMDGTSMAAPVVAGIAALIRSYFPRLTAVEVKEIIMASVVKYDGPVIDRKAATPGWISFSELSVSGGVANAAKAIALAAETAAERK
ncbi:S8 family peptidase [Chitinophaga sp. NPDC101104]|uniref:S8 family peptidase n=1 Tax=Chitinophaga sp. NPDC101104 TaxID=3390561 RepID=UPI003D02E67F